MIRTLMPLPQLLRTARVSFGLVAGMWTALIAGVARSETVADFYAGKQLKFVIRSEPGGGYDLAGRLIGAYIVRHIPGRPSFVPQNMPGGGGIIAANYIGNIAPQDGTYLTIVSDALPMDQSLAMTPTFKSDLKSFGWIGNLGVSNLLTFTYSASATKTFADARTHETLIGGTGAGSPTSWLPLAYNKLLGSKFKLIEGYKSSNDVLLAMSRGEVEGYSGHPWASLVATAPDFVQNKRLSYLAQMGVAREKDLPDVPLVTDLATNPDDRDVLTFITKAFAAGRPLATTPGVPPERLAALRQAFAETVVDPEFLATAEKSGVMVSAVQGAVVESLIADVVGAPQSVKDRVKAVLPARSD